jgi:omega-hydroxy-beta-dihydromenaquinone-9 sulfotransferase
MAAVLEGFDQYKEDDWELLVADGDERASECDIPYKFTPKYQRAAKNNPLCGICLPQWISILIQRHREIEWTTYWPRLLVITLLSCVNSVLAIPEWFFYRTSIENAVIHPRQVFILGHPRTGTTLLHSLLALDTDRFAICTTFCSGFPSCFLWFERFGKLLFSNVMDDTRPMDNVKLHFDLPQEDEIATNVLSSGTSPYMALFFMRQEPTFRSFFAFQDDADGDESSMPPAMIAKARKCWTDAFLLLLRKLTLRASSLRTIQTVQQTQQQQLLLKSPVHTARIPLLLSLFPDAQFLYIHRNPYDVFRSAAHMADTTYWYTYLNTPNDDMIQEFILRQYEILWDRYEQGRVMLRPDQWMEVSFDDVSSKPLETVRSIYKHFSWDWKGIESTLQSELSNVKAYERNRHQPLSPALRRVIEDRWGPSFDRLGYSRYAEE